MDSEIKYLKKKLGRKNRDVMNIRHKLDETLDALDKLQVEYEYLTDNITNIIQETVALNIQHCNSENNSMA